MSSKAKKPMKEDEMKIRWFGNASLLKIFASLISIPTILISVGMLILQNEGGSYKVTHKVFFDIEVAGTPAPRMVIGLFGEAAPRSVQNFVAFATDGFDGKKYQGSKIHRVLKQYMIQGGDVVNGDGTGSLSIYGESFPDENFMVKHVAPGYITMANRGPNTNGCQFYITLVAPSAMDGKHVAFGKVMEGLETLELIEYVETDWDNKPLHPVVIVKSGSLPVTGKPVFISNDPYNFRDWAMTVFPALFLACMIAIIFNHISKILDRGINIHEIITKELEEKQKAEAAAAGGDGEVVKGGDDDSTVRKRQ